MDKSIPSISANQLGVYAFSTPSRKRSILRAQKVKNVNMVNYYSKAQFAILRSFKDGTFQDDVLAMEQARIEAQAPKSRTEVDRIRNNARAIRRFRTVQHQANPPSGKHQIVRSKAWMLVENVSVSVRPDIVTVNEINMSFAYSKLRISGSKYSSDESELVLLLLEMFGERQSTDSLQFDSASSKLIDCLSMQVFKGHAISDYKRRQLKEALAEISAEWPFISNE